jgi:hypothetical protein
LSRATQENRPTLNSINVGRSSSSRKGISGMVIAICEPDKSWLPLRKAPFSIQASVGPRRATLPPPGQPRLLSQQEIAAFVAEAMTDESIAGCAVDFDSCRLQISYPSPGPGGEFYSETVVVDPYAAREFCAGVGGEIRPGCEHLLQRWECMWAEMERRFRLALNVNRWRIVARPQSQHNPEFSEISLADFAAYRIIDWKLGVAENYLGDRIYGIHFVKKFDEALSKEERAFIKEWNAARKVKAAAKFLYQFLEGKVDAKIEPNDKATILKALDGEVDIVFRTVLGRLSHPAQPKLVLSHEAAVKSRRLAMALHNNKPREEILSILKL